MRAKASELIATRLCGVIARPDGVITIQRFLAAGLIDDITITLIPVILGQGRPLFGPIKNDISLTHLATRTFAFGFVQIKYGVVRQI